MIIDEIGDHDRAPSCGMMSYLYSGLTSGVTAPASLGNAYDSVPQHSPPPLVDTAHTLTIFNNKISQTGA